MTVRGSSDGERAGVATPGGQVAVRAGSGVVRIESASILEVMESEESTPIPGAKPPVMGIVNHRGTPVTTIDLAIAMGLGAGQAVARHFVVVRWQDHAVALAVDEVVAVVPAEETGSVGPVVDLGTVLRPIFQSRQVHPESSCAS